jgi:ComF family protein
METVLRALGDVLMSRVCLVCGCTLGVHERHLCLACAADVPYTGFWREVHNPLADRFNEVIERHRGVEPAAYAYATALIYYKGAYKGIPKALKYRGALAAGRYFGTLLGRQIVDAPHFADVDLVLPVPLHWTRRWSRGYNQAEVLARAIAGVLGVPCRADLLVRARRTRTQTHLSVEEKARNVASAFRVRPAGLEPFRHILLLDDTFTTGSTLYACYAALRPHTAARISVATLAAVEGTPSAGR